MVEFLIRCFDMMFALCRLSHKQGDATQLNKEGEKKKAKSTVT